MRYDAHVSAISFHVTKILRDCRHGNYVCVLTVSYNGIGILYLSVLHFDPRLFTSDTGLSIKLLFIYFFLSVVEVRKSLHSRLGLPFDRPLLRIANALNLFTTDGGRSTQKGNLCLLRSKHSMRLFNYSFLIIFYLGILCYYQVLLY